jgi:predicted small lipoprotein YifL
MFDIRQILGPNSLAALGPMVRVALARTPRVMAAGLCTATLLGLTGCGQKGPLYLPDGKTPTAASHAPCIHQKQA